MADIVFNIAKGRVNELARRVENDDPGASRLLLVPIETTGIEADGTLQDYDTLAALLAASNNEQTTMGRKVVGHSTLSVSVDDSGNAQSIDFEDVTWAAATGNAISALILCYDPGAGGDSAIVPLTKHDFAVTPDGSDITAELPAGGIYSAA